MRDAIWLGFAIGCGFAGFIAGTEWSLGWWRKHGKRTGPKRTGITIIDHRTDFQKAWAANPACHSKAFPGDPKQADTNWATQPENLHKAWRDGWTPS